MTDRERVSAAALATVRRGIPADLEWVAQGKFPQMRWRDDSSAVEKRVLRGWLLAAAQRAEPEPDDELCGGATLFVEADRREFGRWLLRAWIKHDTDVPELTETRRKELRGIAERAAELARRLGRGGSDPEVRYRQLLAQEANRPAPDALPHQGLLAVVAACADGSVVDEVRPYLTRWHAERTAQCQALMRMLSGIDDPAVSELITDAGAYPSLA